MLRDRVRCPRSSRSSPPTVRSRGRSALRAQAGDARRRAPSGPGASEGAGRDRLFTGLLAIRQASRDGTQFYSATAHDSEASPWRRWNVVIQMTSRPSYSSTDSPRGRSPVTSSGKRDLTADSSQIVMWSKSVTYTSVAISGRCRRSLDPNAPGQREAAASSASTRAFREASISAASFHWSWGNGSQKQ
jgi:hypothetical protein